MGLPPTGEIIARPMVRRACGCMQEFQHYKIDKYRKERLAKFQGSRCPACVAKLEDERRQTALPPKGEALQALPAGTKVSLTLEANGTWAGTLAAEGITVEAVGPAGAGAQAVVVALARQWLVASQSKDSTK